MPKIELTEDQIIESLKQLSPGARTRALRQLIPAVEDLSHWVERNRPRIEALVRERGLDWNALSEEQREALVDELLHEA